MITSEEDRVKVMENLLRGKMKLVPLDGDWSWEVNFFDTIVIDGVTYVALWELSPG